MNLARTPLMKLYVNLLIFGVVASSSHFKRLKELNIFVCFSFLPSSSLPFFLPTLLPPYPSSSLPFFLPTLPSHLNPFFSSFFKPIFTLLPPFFPFLPPLPPSPLPYFLPSPPPVYGFATRREPSWTSERSLG